MLFALVLSSLGGLSPDGVAILYGFFSGAILSLPPSVIASLSPSLLSERDLELALRSRVSVCWRVAQWLAQFCKTLAIFIGLQVFAGALFAGGCHRYDYRSDLQDGFGSFKEGLDLPHRCVIATQEVIWSSEMVNCQHPLPYIDLFEAVMGHSWRL